MMFLATKEFNDDGVKDTSYQVLDKVHELPALIEDGWQLWEILGIRRIEAIKLELVKSSEMVRLAQPTEEVENVQSTVSP